MALSVSTGTTTGRSQAVEGVRTVTRVEVTFDDDYAENGEAFVASTYHGGSDISHVEVVPTAYIAARGAVTLQYDAANEKIVAWGLGDTAWGELCHCDLSSLTAVVTITGR